MTVEELEYVVHARDHEVVLLKQRVDALNRSLAQGTAAAGSSANANLSKMGRAAGRAGLLITGGMAVAGIAALKVTAEFQQSLNVFGAVTEATGKQMRAVRTEAIKLGADIKLPSTSAKDAAFAMTELAKGGLSVKQSMEAARGTLQLSAAAGIENAEAAKIQVRALNAFGLKGRDAAKVADLLAAAANSSTGEITDFADGFRNAAAQASVLGIPIEDLTTALALMADKGIEGATAGVSLKVMMTRLVPMTKRAVEAMSELGIVTKEGNNRLFDQQGRFVGLAKAQDIFRTAMKGMSAEQRIATLQSIFGQDAQRAANFVLLGGAKAWAKMHKEVTKQGEAARIANARNKGLKGATDALKSTLETLAIVFGTVLAPAAEAFLRGFLLPATAALGNHKTAALVLSAALTTLGLGLLALSLAVKIYSFATSAATASTVKFLLALATNPVFLIIAAIVALGVALVIAYRKSETFRGVVQRAFQGVAAAAGVLADAFRWFRDHAGTIWSIVKVAFWPQIQAIKLGFELAKAAAGVLADIFRWFRDHAGAIWSAVKGAIAPYVAAIKLGLEGAQKAGEALADAFRWVRDHAGPIWQRISAALKKPLEAMNAGFDKMAGAVGKIVDAFKWIIEHAGKLGGVLGKIGGAAGAAGSEAGKARPPAGPTGPISAVSNISPKLWDEIAVARGMGLTAPTAQGGYRPGDDGDHGRFPSHAVDAAGSRMRDFALAMMGRAGVKDVIYGGLPFWQDNGAIVQGWARNELLRRQHLDHVHTSVFDQGGYLPPGLTLALNNTGRPERVIGPGGDSAPVVININVEGSVTSERDLLAAMHEGLKAIDRRNHGTRLRT